MEKKNEKKMLLDSLLDFLGEEYASNEKEIGESLKDEGLDLDSSYKNVLKGIERQEREYENNFWVNARRERELRSNKARSQAKFNELLKLGRAELVKLLEGSVGAGEKALAFRDLVGKLSDEEMAELLSDMNELENG